MGDMNTMIRKEIEKIWPEAKKTLTQLNKDASKLIKKTEKNLFDAYAKTKKTTEDLIIKAQREKLYYELGRAVASRLSADQRKNKTIAGISAQLRRLSRSLREK